MFDVEKQFNQRMKQLETLKKNTAKRYVDIYENQDRLSDLFPIANNREIDHGYIDEFLHEIKVQIIKEIKQR